MSFTLQRSVGSGMRFLGMIPGDSASGYFALDEIEKSRARYLDNSTMLEIGFGTLKARVISEIFIPGDSAFF